MLYATTRSKTDSYTAYRTLHDDKATDGGCYIPFRMPKFERSLVLKMKEQTFSETVSQVLNIFFSARITAWDVDCAIGKNAARIIGKSRKVYLVKLWDNPDNSYTYICEKMFETICGDGSNDNVTEWAYIAIRISVLFGIYSLLQKEGVSSFDVCVNAESFSDPMAVWYARYMGLPVGNIICACNEESALWDFVYRGEINENIDGLERLVYATLGYQETRRFLDTLENNRTYLLHPEQLKKLNQGLFVSVAGKGRAESVITSFYGANDCILDPETAISFGSLQDYRSRVGESTPTIVLWDESPMKYLPEIMSATGLGESDIRSYTNNT